VQPESRSRTHRKKYFRDRFHGRAEPIVFFVGVLGLVSVLVSVGFSFCCSSVREGAKWPIEPPGGTVNSHAGFARYCV
jgi:hypothetical protein